MSRYSVIYDVVRRVELDAESIDEGIAKFERWMATGEPTLGVLVDTDKQVDACTSTCEIGLLDGRNWSNLAVLQQEEQDPSKRREFEAQIPPDVLAEALIEEQRARQPG